MTSAFGKVILLGEHAVVYGHPALAGAIDRGIRCRVTSHREGPTTILRVPAWDLRAEVGGADPVARALEALLAEVGSGAWGLVIEADADVPAAAGLGSSAALSVALTRCLAKTAGQSLSREDVERIADAAERCFHANPSGVDVALANRGGLGVYRRGQGFSPIDARPIRLAVGLTGESRRTADMVNRFAEVLGRREGAEDRLVALGAIAERGVEAARGAQLRDLGELMGRAQDLLRWFEMSTESIDRMVERALRAGALGAKLTGAGGGGAVIALAPGREHDVLRAWQEAGWDGFVCVAGVSP